VLGAALLFGTTGTAQELGPDGTTPLGVGTLRISVGAVALWALAHQLPSPAELRRHAGLFGLAAIGVASYQPTFFSGTSRAGVALGTVVALGSGPLFTGAIEAVVLRRPPASRWWAATAITIAGGGLIASSGGSDAGSGAELLGLVGALAAGLSYALYALAAKALIERGVHSTVALAWPFTLGAAALLPVAAAREPLGWAGSPGGVLLLAHLGVATVGLAYHLYGRGLRTLDTATAVTLTLAEPLTAAVLGMVVLGERLGPSGWVGAVAVLGGLAIAGGAFERSYPPRRGSSRAARRRGVAQAGRS
jgi:DME family drug/metabolite transporter